jgi:hypothetical protein
MADRVDLTDSKLIELLSSVEACRDLVSPEEWAEYERCRDSIVEARRAAERMAPFMWVG